MLKKSLLVVGLMAPITFVLGADALGSPLQSVQVQWLGPVTTAVALFVGLAGLVWWYRREKQLIVQDRQN